MGVMYPVAVIEDPAAAEVSLDPVRARLLAELARPASATMLAARVDLPRQKVNYHLRALEKHGLVELVEERHRQVGALVRPGGDRIHRPARRQKFLASPSAIFAPVMSRRGESRLTGQFLPD